MDLIAILENVNGSSFIGIDTVTVPVLTGGKSNPMQGKVTKKVTGSSVMVYQNKKSNAYENMVNRRLIKEGKDPSFTVGPRTWGERIDGTPFVSHKGKIYLEVIHLKAGKASYYLDGVEISKSDVIGLKDAPESEQGQNGLSDKVIIRTYSLESIIGIRIDGKEFCLNA